MISLETEFVSGEGGFAATPLTYRQINRTDKVALYERSLNGQVRDYEVFLIRVDPKGKEMKFPGGVVKVLEDDKENYASTGKFGTTAWSFSGTHGLACALRRFDNLCQEAVAEPAEKKEITLPSGEFTVGELAEKNGVSYAPAFLFVKAGLEANTIKFVREERRNVKGKPSKIFAKA